MFRRKVFDQDGAVRNIPAAVASNASQGLKLFMTFFAAQGYGLKFELLKVRQTALGMSCRGKQPGRAGLGGAGGDLAQGLV